MDDTTRWWLRKLRHAAEDAVLSWDEQRQCVPWDIDRDIRFYAGMLGVCPGMEELANEAYRIGAYSSRPADYVALLDRIWALFGDDGTVSEISDTGT